MRLLLPIALMLLVAGEAGAARIGELVEAGGWEQVKRFFQFSDRGLRIALLGGLLFGAACGVLGSFIVVRKMALLGDALSHAVLPGVALGFAWGMTKDPVAILVGATVAGLLGALVVEAIQRTTRIKQDAALGIVLASFFAVGLCLMRMIQNRPGSAQISGLNTFLFGDVATLSAADVRTVAVVVALTLFAVAALYRPLLTLSFDRAFAASTGLPVRMLDGLFQLLLAFAIVVSLQAVGVVLVSALLITPAAAAYLLTDRLHKMIWIAAIIGMSSAVLGVFFSFLGNDLPTGPFMVLAATAVFGASYVFAPKHGRLTIWLRRRARRRKVREDHALKEIYRILEGEGRGKVGEGVALPQLADARRMSLTEMARGVRELVRDKLVALSAGGGSVSLLPEGMRRARQVVRNHRLWELYLTNEADYAPDHVHDDADKIEHFLDGKVLAELERQLDFPETDPHGKPIPGTAGAGG